MTTKGSKTRIRPITEELEPRILYSADAAVLLHPPVLMPSAEVRSIHAYAPVPFVEQYIPGNTGGHGSQPTPQQVVPISSTKQAGQLEVVFVDTAVPDYQMLVRDITSHSNGQHQYDIVLLNAQSDGIRQISETLATLKGVSAVHIISHGADGQIQLGDTILSSDTLSANTAQIRGWGGSLIAGADLLIYGCDVAAHADGRALVNDLGALTGANVAASENVTGAAGKGGDWTLEYRTGSIESTNPIDAATQQSWAGTLGIAQASVSTGGSTPPVTSLTFGHTVGAGSNGVLLVEVALRGTSPITSVTYGSAALTRVAGVNAAANDVRTELWYLAAPATGTANVVVTLPAAETLCASAATFFGVDQTTPFGAAVTASGSGGSPTINVAAAPGQIVVDCNVVREGVILATPFVGQSAFWSLDTGLGGSQIWGGGSIEAGASSVTMAWATSGPGPGNWASIAVPLNPATNSAPVLSGSNNLSPINENPAGNPGTLVSALIVGHVTDADGSALGGIAVTAVDNSHGAWQYSIDGGSTWTGFGTPSTTSARLLAADTNTYVRFVPNANWSGTVSAGLTFNAWDQTAGTAGGTADVSINGGATAFSSATTNASITVNGVDQAPVGTSNTITTLEDTTYTLTTGDFGFTDPNDSPANTLLAVKITTLPGAGTLTLSGVAVTAGQFVSAANIAAGNLKFTPAPNANGAGYSSFTFQVQDDGGTANGGVDLDPTPKTMTVNVTSLNDAPVGTNNTVTTLEDTTYTLTTGDFGFTDPNDSPANSLLAVKITTLPGAGTLTLSGVAVTAGQFVSAANIAAGNLKFTPAPNANGTGYAAFTFQVQDDGGTTNGGVDLDQTPRTMTVNVTSVNDAPVGTNTTIAALEDTTYTLTTGDFGFTDPSDSPANTLLAVKITTLPGAGSLTLSGIAVTAGQVVSAANIAAGNLKFTPAPNVSGAGYAAFTFQVQDDGGTANGGVDLDPTPRTMTVNVTSVNDAPVGTSNTVTTLEDTTYTLTTGDFGFTDPIDSPANTLLAVKITTLPGAGSLTLSGVAVTAGQVVSAANIAAGNLKFAPAPNANGTGYAAFTFQVQDDGGTANGGVDLDPTPRTMTVNVTSVNDAPVGTSNTVTTLEDTTYTLTTGDFGFTDPNDSPANSLLAVKITTLPGTGSLTLSGIAVTAGQVVSAANIAAGNLKFTPAPNASGAGYAAFTFQVQDDGGTANGGVDLDPTPRTMTVNVTSVNDAPVGTSNTVTTLEDTTYTLTTGDFGFTDPNDSPANSLLAVKITTLPGTGSLTLSGIAVTAGQVVSAANIAAGNLKFTPAPNASGAGYAAFTFQVQDDGGTANGGVDLDPTPRTMTVNVPSVNDAPVGTSNTVTTLEDATYTFTTADFGFTDPSESRPNHLLAVKITTLPEAGTLTLSGITLTAGEFISAANIAAGDLRFTPGPAATGTGFAAFTFQVQDDGGTAHGGVSLDPAPKILRLNLTAPPSRSMGDGPNTTGSQYGPAGGPSAMRLASSAPAAGSSSTITTVILTNAEPPTPSVDLTPTQSDRASKPATVAKATNTTPFATAMAGEAHAATTMVPSRAISTTPAANSAANPAGSPVRLFLIEKFNAAWSALFSFRPDAVTTATMGPEDSAAGNATHAPGFISELNKLRDTQGSVSRLDERLVASTAVAGAGLTVGYIAWLLRAGTLLSSLMSSLPAWRLVDPLPILARVDDDEETEDDESLQALVKGDATAHPDLMEPVTPKQEPSDDSQPGAVSR